MKAHEQQIAGWRQEITRFHGLLQPFLKQKVDLSDPNWFAKGHETPHPLSDRDRAGYRDVLFQMSDYYLTCSGEQRQEIRVMLVDFPSISSVYPFSPELIKSPEDEGLFEQCIAFISMTSKLPRDPRDTDDMVYKLCRQAKMVGIKTKPILERVSEISDDTDKMWSFGTMQHLINNYANM